MSLTAGIYRTTITPPYGVELAGLGYYLERTWQHVRDHLTATAFVVHDGTRSVAIIATDLMYMDAGFTHKVRQMVTQHTDLQPHAICVSASHSHNAPTAGLIRGAGEQNPDYLHAAAQQAATAAIVAWHRRQPATLHAGKSTLTGFTFNRTRQIGSVDTQVTAFRADDTSGRPFAIVANFHAHPTVMMSLGNTHVSRDYPGHLVDLLENTYPNATAMYVQGSCGDVNFLSELWQPDRCLEPGRALAGKTIEALSTARRIDNETVGAAISRPVLPTKRFAKDLVLRENEEGHYRLKTGDTTGWRESLGRVMVNYPDRFPERYGGDLKKAVRALARFAVAWTEDVLPDLETRPETLETEVQAIRLGDAYLVANPAELFSQFSLDVRRAWPHKDLMVVGYANASISYMPDAHDIEHSTYAAAQSPKYAGHFPFVPESGPCLVNGMVEALEKSTQPH
jgi:hypothetical protein